METSIDELLKDKDFVKKIFKMETPEEIQKAFSDKGVKISIRELEEIAKNVSELINSPEEYRKITDTENVSGGEIHKNLRTAAALISGISVSGSAIFLAYKANQAINKANDTMDRANQILEEVPNGWFAQFRRR